ncbi:hypothetical protein [Litorisediminicola beolgyonensis]|uniref:Uncharacterized protein n=1 Tax=Litorisediminicola beolgyonensis TaxID=1173614 RepID=A0ABW3ZG59_9RHOB
MDQKLVGTGLVALLVGFAAGWIGAPDAPTLSQIGNRLSEELTPTSEATSALSDRLGALEEQLSGLSEQVAAASEPDGSAAAISALTEEIAALSSQVQSAMSASAESQTGVADALGTLGDQLSQIAQGGGGGASSSGSDSEAEAPAESASASMDNGGGNSGGGEGTRAGSTVSFADGAIRVFVSRVDSEGGSARLAIDGALVTLAAGESHEIEVEGEPCSVTLDGVSGNSAQISGGCGDSGGSGEISGEAASIEGGSSGEGSSAEGGSGEGSSDEGGSALRMGETAILGEGAARVFLSGMSEENGTARIAVNGVIVETLESGASLEVPGTDGCSVTLDSVSAEGASVSYGC